MEGAGEPTMSGFVTLPRKVAQASAKMWSKRLTSAIKKRNTYEKGTKEWKKWDKTYIEACDMFIAIEAAIMQENLPGFDQMV
jgi:hypothetical protein